MQEMLTLVDRADREIGSAEKMDAHRQGLLHRAFSVFVFDAAGALLLQRRAEGKYHSAGLWSNTCCGHPRFAETLERAAHRRLGEEMGFDCPLRNVGSTIYRLPVPGGLIEHEFDHFFIGRSDAQPRPCSDEVGQWTWSALPALAAALRRRPGEFTPWLRAIVDAVGIDGLTRWSVSAGR